MQFPIIIILQTIVKQDSMHNTANYMQDSPRRKFRYYHPEKISDLISCLFDQILSLVTYNLRIHRDTVVVYAILQFRLYVGHDAVLCLLPLHPYANILYTP